MGDVSAEPLRLVAEGTLATRPLSHVLVHVRTKRLTGRLVLRGAGGGGGALGVWRGRLAMVSTSPHAAYFGEVAVSMGFVDSAAAAATQRDAAATRRLHGEVLVERGRLTAADRDAVLVEQACRKVHGLLSLPPLTGFAFYEERPGAEPPVIVDPVMPLWRAIRGGSSADVPGIVASLERFMESAFRMVNEAPVAGAEFSDDETTLCESIVGTPLTFAQLRSAFPQIPRVHLERLLYLLLLTSSVQPEAANPDAGRETRRIGSMDADAIAEVLQASKKPTSRPPATAHTGPPATMPRNSTAPVYDMPVGPVRRSVPSPRVSTTFASPVTPPAQKKNG